MSAELIILLGAILGAFGVFLVFQLRKTLIERQIPLNDIDAIVKALFEIQFNREFALKIAIGTGIGALGAILAMTALVAGAPTNGGFQELLLYGFLWGFAGNGILRVFTMIPDIFTVLNIAKENASLRRENQALAANNFVLQSQVNRQFIQEQGLTLEQKPLKEQPVETQFPKIENPPIENPPIVNNEQVTPLKANQNPDGTKTV